MRMIPTKLITIMRASCLRELFFCMTQSTRWEYFVKRESYFSANLSMRDVIIRIEWPLTGVHFTRRFKQAFQQQKRRRFETPLNTSAS